MVHVDGITRHICGRESVAEHICVTSKDIPKLLVNTIASLPTMNRSKLKRATDVCITMQQVDALAAGNQMVTTRVRLRCIRRPNQMGVEI